MDRRLHIGDLARATDTKVVTIRYYEQAGLLPEPPRSDGNYRIYGQPHLERLRFVRRARGLGFSLSQIRALLDLASDRSRSCAEVDRMARLQLEEVERKIADLSLLRTELRHTIGDCTNNTIAECRILKRFASGNRPQSGRR
jgi:Cu(I)-responsive transcriptional regulator